ncbi:endogenous retrovirus group K member 13-1 Env polyprotein-like isoform X1 [Cavia porcellus]|uniref:endogenous retrovirus group K member 13-1 Env polyprotein-like isoform X1 n=1 Tax=Cavia porcellus TaxID=10141 RepID=UPI002FE2B89E
MEFSSGSLDDGSGPASPDPVHQPRRQLPKEPEPCLQKRARNQLEAEDAEFVPIAAMARLQLRKSRRSQRPNLNPLPTWGQLKKLTIEGQRLVLQAGKPLNPENLFLALCALLTVASGTEVPPHSYGAYIPNPPLLEPVKWGTSDILLYTTPREILSAPWADLTPHNQDDGTLFNFTYYGNQRPICIGEPPCIPLGWQYWIQHGIKAGNKRTRLQALAAQTFNVTWKNLTAPDTNTFPVCPEFTYKNISYNPIIWQLCMGKFAKNIDGYIIWGPFGKFVNGCAEWNETRCNLSVVYSLPDPKKITDGAPIFQQKTALLWWGDGGIANPAVAAEEYPHHLQNHIWKIPAAMQPVTLYNVSYSGTSRSVSTTYNFTRFKMYNITVCAPLPYVFLVGTFNFTHFSCTCLNCQLFTCLNSTLNFTKPYTVMLLQQKTHIWLPVNLTRPWSQDPVISVTTEFFKHLLKRTKRFIGIVVAVLLSLITVASLAAVSGVALHTSLQEKHVVELWHENSHELWLTQWQINAKLQQQIDLLKQTVEWMGRKILALQHQVFLKCDWNSTTFCITQRPYNQTEHEWEMIRMYLNGNTSAQEEIESLHNQIDKDFAKQNDDESLAQFAQLLAQSLKGLDSKGIWQSITHTFSGMGLSLIIVLIAIVLVYFYCIRRNAINNLILWKLLLKNKKEGSVGDEVSLCRPNPL